MEQQTTTGEVISDAAAGHLPVQSTAPTQEKPSFDALLKQEPEYKKAYDERMQKALQGRFKTAQADKERLNRLESLLQQLSPQLDLDGWEQLLSHTVITPQEGVLGNRAAAAVIPDPAHLTASQREDIRTRVRRGERVIW